MKKQVAKDGNGRLVSKGKPGGRRIPVFTSKGAGRLWRSKRERNGWM